MAKAGLKKVVKTVRTKRGTARRTYWVKTAGKALLGAAALAGGAYLAHRAAKHVGGRLRQHADSSISSRINAAVSRHKDGAKAAARGALHRLPEAAGRVAGKGGQLAGRGVGAAGRHVAANAGGIGAFTGRTAVRAAKAAPGAAWETAKFAGRFARGFYRGAKGQ